MKQILYILLTAILTAILVITILLGTCFLILETQKDEICNVINEVYEAFEHKLESFIDYNTIEEMIEQAIIDNVPTFNR